VVGQIKKLMTVYFLLAVIGPSPKQTPATRTTTKNAQTTKQQQTNKQPNQQTNKLTKNNSNNKNKGSNSATTITTIQQHNITTTQQHNNTTTQQHKNNDTKPRANRKTNKCTRGSPAGTHKARTHEHNCNHTNATHLFVFPRFRGCSGAVCAKLSDQTIPTLLWFAKNKNENEQGINNNATNKYMPALL
jgi:hypothetical protein